MHLNKYQGSCVDLGADFIWALRTATDKTRIKHATFRRHAPGLALWAEKRKYAKRSPGLTLKADSHVQYYKATVRGHVCYWLTWSGFEHVWAPLALGDIRAWWAGRCRGPGHVGY